MALKLIFICALVFVKTITGQCIGNGLNNGFFGNGMVDRNGFGPNSLGGAGGYGTGTATSGGGFTVTSSSPIAPTGVSVLAENLAIEGPLAIGGQLPFLGTVAVEGALPAAGAGVVTYGCGNGNIGITSEGLPGPTVGPYGHAAGPAFGPGLAGGHGFNGLGFGGPGIGSSCFY